MWYSVTAIIKKKHIYKTHFQSCTVELSQNLWTVRYMHLLNHQDNKLSPRTLLQTRKKFYKETYDRLTPATSVEFFQELFLHSRVRCNTKQGKKINLKQAHRNMLFQLRPLLYPFSNLMNFSLH